MKKHVAFLSLLGLLFLPGCSLSPQNQGNGGTINNVVKEVSKISIIAKPSKTLYEKGENFEAQGIKVRVVYADNSVEVVDWSKCTFSNIDQNTGEVTASFGGKTTSLFVSFIGEHQQEEHQEQEQQEEEHHEQEHQEQHEDEDKDVPVSDSISLISPINNEVVKIVDDEVRSYLNDFKNARKNVLNDYLFDKDECDESKTSTHSARISDYVKDKKDHSKGKSVTFTFSSSLPDTKYIVKLSTKADFSDAKIYETSMKSLSLHNLFRNKTYYWKVLNSSKTTSSSVGVFKTEDAPRMIYTDKLNNVRDYGGYKTASGKTIKQGLIYRGHEINVRDYNSDNSSKTAHHFNLTDDVKNTLLNDLGIKVEFDLRSHDELDPNLIGSPLGNTVEYKRINTTSGWCPSYNYISGEKGIYNNKYIKDVFVAIADAAKNQIPIYIHCMGGADRTGSIFFCLGGLLGMSFTDLCAEYELTSFAKNLRERDVTSSYGSFPLFISGFYDDITGIDPSKGHNIQTVIKNLLLKMDISESQINDIQNFYLEN